MSQARLLIVKTSSLGDIVHTFPVIADIRQHLPRVHIDWVVERSFAELPRLHSGIDGVFTVALRQWRRALGQADTWRDMRASFNALAHEPYDAILDLQGLIKSAWIASRARGVRHGFDRASAREPLASWGYHFRHAVPRAQAAVTRSRQLTGAALGYAPEGPPVFLFDTERLRPVSVNGISSRPYACLMPSASREAKLWPEEDWRALISNLLAAGLTVRILSGNAIERMRAQALCAGFNGAIAELPVPLSEVASWLAHASLVVGLDSGITHLAAALGRPTVGIYADHSPLLTPLTGAGLSASLGGKGTPPTRAEVLDAVEKMLAVENRAFL